jgi:hypothetical protein
VWVACIRPNDASRYWPFLAERQDSLNVGENAAARTRDILRGIGDQSPDGCLRWRRLLAGASAA